MYWSIQKCVTKNWPHTYAKRVRVNYGNNFALAYWTKLWVHRIWCFCGDIAPFQPFVTCWPLWWDNEDERINVIESWCWHWLSLTCLSQYLAHWIQFHVHFAYASDGCSLELRGGLFIHHGKKLIGALPPSCPSTNIPFEAYITIKRYDWGK